MTTNITIIKYFECLYIVSSNKFRKFTPFSCSSKSPVHGTSINQRKWMQEIFFMISWYINDNGNIIEALLNQSIDSKATYFGTYDEAKARIELKIKISQAISKGKKRITKLTQNCYTLLLKEGKRDVEDEIDETKSKEEPIKKKGEVIITKPSKSSTTILTRRTSRKKLKLGEAEDIVFN